MLTGRAMKTAVAFASRCIPNCAAIVGGSQGGENRNGKEHPSSHVRQRVHLDVPHLEASWHLKSTHEHFRTQSLDTANNPKRGHA